MRRVYTIDGDAPPFHDGDVETPNVEPGPDSPARRTSVSLGNLKLTSSAFEDGGEIPRECGYKHGNKEPPLAVSGIPEEAESLVLIMDDPDAMEPAGKVWVHLVAWNIEPDTDENGNMDNIFDGQRFKPHKLGTNDFGEEGYGGPAPPDKRHTYVFKVYALDREMDIEVIEGVVVIKIDGYQDDMYNAESITKDVIEKAMEGHIIEQTQLTGTYAP